MPRKIQKQWKKHLSTYHLIRKTIYLAKHNPQWLTHPIIEELKNHTHTNIPPPPNQIHLQQEWLINIATIAKTTNSQARAITTKYTRDCIKKAISKYRQQYEKNPKKIHKKNLTITKRHH